MSVINILMQLRKVCNHPNLFDPRPIHSPFITQGICYTTASLVLTALDHHPFKVGIPGVLFHSVVSCLFHPRAGLNVAPLAQALILACFAGRQPGYGTRRADRDV